MLLVSVLAQLRMASASSILVDDTNEEPRCAPAQEAHFQQQSGSFSPASEATSSGAVPAHSQKRFYAGSCIGTLVLIHKHASVRLAELRKDLNARFFNVLGAFLTEAAICSNTKTNSAELIAMQESVSGLSGLGKSAMDEFERIYFRECTELMSSIDKFNEDNALFFNRKESGVKNSLYEHMALNSSGHCFRSTDFEFFSEVLCIGRNPSEKPDLKSILQSYVDICSYVCDKADELTADIDAYLMEKARRVKDENIEMTEEIRFEVHEYIEEHKDKFEEAYDYVRTQLSSACSRLRYLESVLTRFNQKRI